MKSSHHIRNGLSIALIPPLDVRLWHQAEAAERAQRDRAASEQRGPAPEPARSFRLPQQLLPDLLVLWELLQTLAPTLQVRLPQPWYLLLLQLWLGRDCHMTGVVLLPLHVAWCQAYLGLVATLFLPPSLVYSWRSLYERGGRRYMRSWLVARPVSAPPHPPPCGCAPWTGMHDDG